MSEQAKMGLFSSAMQTLRQTLSLRPKSGISGVIKSFCVQLERIRISAFLFSPSDLSCFCFFFFVYPLVLLMASVPLWTHFSTSSNGGKQHQLYQTGIFICCWYFIWSGETWLSQPFEELGCLSVWRAAPKLCSTGSWEGRNLLKTLQGESSKHLWDAVLYLAKNIRYLSLPIDLFNGDALSKWKKPTDLEQF